MVSINRYEAQNRITNILSEYLSMLKEAEPNKRQLTLETNKLFCNSEKLATILENNELSTNLYPLLSLDGIKQLYNSCIELARCYELSSYRKYKDACIEYKNIFKIGSSLNSFTAEDSALKVEEGRCVVFKLEQLNDNILQSGENIYYTVEWKKTDSSGKNTSGIINNLIKNNFDDDSRDREFSFDKAGKYKIHADYVQRLYGRSEYRKVIEHNEITVLVVPGDEKIKNMKLQDKYIYAIRYADWDEAICDAKTMAIMLSATALIFGIIALTPIDEVMEIMAPIFQAIGIGGAIEEFIKSLYLIADFIDRVNKAQSEAALQEAGDVFAQIIVGLGIAGLSALLTYLSGKAGTKAKERLKARQQNKKEASGTVIGKRANDLEKAPEGYELVHYKDVDGIIQTNIRRKDSTIGDFLFVDENEIKRLVKYPDIDAVLKKIDKLPKRSEIKADDIFEELIALRKKSEDIIKEAGYSHLDVVTSQKNNEMIKKLQESISDDKLIENIREGRDAGNKSLEKILNELDKSKVMRGVRITRDNLKDFIPDVSSHKSSQIINAIRNRSDSQDVIDYMQELFDKYGRVEQVMQEHHWIKQEYITNGEYPFLKYDLLKDEKNLSTIVGHVGCHKDTYNKFLEKELKNILDYWEISSGDIDGTNDLILNLIEDISNKVKRDNNFMNNRKLYILN